MSVRFQSDIRIPLRDGIELAATAYFPGNLCSQAPCIFALTPYTADLFHDRGVYFASNGLPFVIVDVRGRGNSQGTFRPYRNEARDGYDVVEWLARQPWCNGNVAMWGGSYLGHSQWATASELPRELATIVPTAAPYLGLDFPMRNNVFYPYVARWLAFTSGRTSQARLFADDALWSSVHREWNASGRAFRELDAVVGDAAPIFQEWLSHPEPDAYWDEYNPTVDQYTSLDIPILTITGSYDDDQPGALEHYRRHMQHSAPAARARHYLIIGHWDHAGTGKPRAEFGGLKLGAQSMVDLWRVHVEWYAWTMQGGPRPAFLKKRVAFYVMGSETWRYADTLDEVTSRHDAFFLDSTGRANDVFSSGSLGPAPGKGPPDRYRHDPRDTHGPEVAEATVAADSLVDQSIVLALRGRSLVYHSAPFPADTEISGFFKLSAWIAIDCPDTDLHVSVYEIGLAGGSIRLTTDVMRARHRAGLRTPSLIQTCSALRYDFERFTFISRRIARGHRLRLLIAPIGRVNQTQFVQKNFNAGGIVAAESAADARVVTVRLFHDAQHPSALYVPLGRMCP